MNGNRPVVVESAERNPLELSVEVIRICCGDEEWNLVVGKAREIVAQEELST